MSADISMTWPQYLRRECVVDGLPHPLTPKLAEIVLVLLTRRGHAVHIDDLIEAVYPDPDTAPETDEKCIMAGLTYLRRHRGIPITTIGQRQWMIERPDAGETWFRTPGNFGFGRRRAA